MASTSNDLLSEKLKSSMSLFGFDRIRLSKDPRESVFILKKLDKFHCLSKNEEVSGENIVSPESFMQKLKKIKCLQEKHEVSIEMKLEALRESIDDAKRQINQILDQIYRDFIGEASVSLLALTIFRGFCGEILQKTEMIQEESEFSEEVEPESEKLRQVEVFLKEVETLARHLAKEEQKSHCVGLLSRLESANSSISTLSLDISNKLEGFLPESPEREEKFRRTKVEVKGPSSIETQQAKGQKEGTSEATWGKESIKSGAEVELTRPKTKPKEIFLKTEIKNIFPSPITGASRGIAVNPLNPKTAIFLTESGEIQCREMVGKFPVLWKKQLNLGKGHCSHYNCLAISQNGANLAVSSSSKLTIHIMTTKGESKRVISCQDSSGLAVLKEKMTNSDRNSSSAQTNRKQIWRILFIDDQNLLVSLNNGSLAIFNILTGARVRNKSFPFGSFESLVMLSAGRVAGGTTQGFLVFFKVSLHENEQRKIHEDRVTLIKSGMNGKILATASQDKTIALMSGTGSFRMYWALRTFEAIREMEFDGNSEFLLIFYGPEEPKVGKGWLSLLEVATGFQLAKITYDQSPLSVSVSRIEPWEFIGGDGAGNGLSVFALESEL